MPFKGYKPVREDFLTKIVEVGWPGETVFAAWGYRFYQFARGSFPTSCTPTASFFPSGTGAAFGELITPATISYGGFSSPDDPPSVNIFPPDELEVLGEPIMPAFTIPDAGNAIQATLGKPLGASVRSPNRNIYYTYQQRLGDTLCYASPGGELGGSGFLAIPYSSSTGGLSGATQMPVSVAGITARLRGKPISPKEVRIEWTSGAGTDPSVLGLPGVVAGVTLYYKQQDPDA